MTSYSGETGFMNNWIEVKGWYVERAIERENQVIQINLQVLTCASQMHSFYTLDKPHPPPFFVCSYGSYIFAMSQRVKGNNIIVILPMSKPHVWTTENWSFPHILEKLSTFATSPQTNVKAVHLKQNKLLKLEDALVDQIRQIAIDLIFLDWFYVLEWSRVFR